MTATGVNYNTCEIQVTDCCDGFYENPYVYCNGRSLNLQNFNIGGISFIRAPNQGMTIAGNPGPSQKTALLKSLQSHAQRNGNKLSFSGTLTDGTSFSGSGIVSVCLWAGGAPGACGSGRNIEPKSKKLEDVVSINQPFLQPNPSDGNTTLNLSDVKAVAQVIIADMAGRVLWSSNTFEGDTIQLPVAGFTAGNYLVIVMYEDNGRETLKLIKQ